MANVRRLVLAKASHTRPNRRGRLAPPTAGSASRVAVSTNASVRPSLSSARRKNSPTARSPASRLRFAGSGTGGPQGDVPVTAIGPASKFRPDRCRRLLRPPLAGHAPCFIGPPALQKSAPDYRRLPATRPSGKSTTIYSPGSSISGELPIHGYAHRVSLVLPCTAFDGPAIIKDEPHAHSSPSTTPCASPNTNWNAVFNPSGSRRIRADLAPDGFNTAPSQRAGNRRLIRKCFAHSWLANETALTCRHVGQPGFH